MVMASSPIFLPRLARSAIVVLALTAFGLSGAAAASAAPGMVGIGNQQANMFTAPLFEQLHVPISRLVVSYDAVLRRTAEVTSVDAWVRGAAADGVAPLISFNHHRGCYDTRGHGSIPRRPSCRLPTVAAYQRAFAAFRHRYPMIRAYSPWNEANHRSQPTYDNPRRAAQFYNVVRRACPACEVVAADVLDQDGVGGWLKRFERYAQGSPRIWGLHNYEDVNHHTTSRTRAVLAVVRGQVWLTETGGIVKFPHLPFSPRRAAGATRFMFQLAALSSRITRLYIYQWSGARPGERFDAGLTGPHGAPRPAYFVVRRHLRLTPSRSAPPPAQSPAGPAPSAGGSGPPSGSPAPASRP